MTEASVARDQRNATGERDPGNVAGDPGFTPFDAEQQHDADTRDVARAIAAPPRFALFVPKPLVADNLAIFPYANASPGHEFIDLIEARRAYENGLRLAQTVETSLGALLDGKL